MRERKCKLQSPQVATEICYPQVTIRTPTVVTRKHSEASPGRWCRRNARYATRQGQPLRSEMQRPSASNHWPVQSIQPQFPRQLHPSISCLVVLLPSQLGHPPRSPAHTAHLLSSQTPPFVIAWQPSLRQGRVRPPQPRHLKIDRRPK